MPAMAILTMGLPERRIKKEITDKMVSGRQHCPQYRDQRPRHTGHPVPYQNARIDRNSSR